MSGERDYVRDSEQIVAFLESHQDATGAFPYREALQEVANRTSRTVRIDLGDLRDFTADDEFVDAIHYNAPRYVALFADAIEAALPDPTEEIVDEDVYDTLLSHRTHQQQAVQGNEPGVPAADQAAAAARQFPPALRRRFEVRLLPDAKTKPRGVREIKAENIGHLVKVRGIVTRLTEVKPMITIATYTCDQCGFELYQEVTDRQFTPLTQCESQACAANRTMGKLYMQTRGSKFIKFQELKIQEMASQVPVGHVPRTTTVHVKGELTRQCSPGDIVTVCGIYLPITLKGYRAMRAGLVADTFIEGMSIERAKKSYAEYDLSEEMLAQIEAHREDSQIYNKLANSLAPEIWGMADVKKALLLLLVGGVTRVLKDKMTIRGDCHVLLCGDPGVAKSQLLKYISRVAPRGIYTTGKGSSGVGLTAAVLRDPVTKEMTLEGGALVLADMGICCIDEFDKMDDSDRTAIHEVMEQQTVSIAKAGITTTLNARTAVLAAANPAYGRYNRKRSPSENINLPAALLSRFDILFLLLDTPSEDHDRELAHHICQVHRTNKAPELGFEPLTPEFIRAYVAAARRIEPCVPRELTDYITGAFVTMRREERGGESLQTYTSARTLLAILRFSQALARLRFSPEVAQGDVDEAMRLMYISKASLTEEELGKRGLDPRSAIYTIIRDLAQSQKSGTRVKYDDVLPKVLAKGYTEDLLQDTLDSYANINVWQLNKKRTTITFVVE